MKNINKNEDNSYTIVLHLKQDERKRLKKLAKKLDLNDFETLKYCVQLISWWSKNEIEGEE